PTPSIPGEQGTLDHFLRRTADAQERDHPRTQEARAATAAVGYDAATITRPDAGAGDSHVGAIRGPGQWRRGQGPGGRVADLRGLLSVQGQPTAPAARRGDANRHQRSAADVDAEQPCASA